MYNRCYESFPNQDAMCWLLTRLRCGISSVFQSQRVLLLFCSSFWPSEPHGSSNEDVTWCFRTPHTITFLLTSHVSDDEDDLMCRVNWSSGNFNFSARYRAGDTTQTRRCPHHTTDQPRKCRNGCHSLRQGTRAEQSRGRDAQWSAPQTGLQGMRTNTQSMCTFLVQHRAEAKVHSASHASPASPKSFASTDKGQPTQKKSFDPQIAFRNSVASLLRPLAGLLRLCPAT